MCKYEDFLSILYAILSLFIPILDHLNNEQFILLVNVLQQLIVKILILDLAFETNSNELFTQQDDVQQMQIDECDKNEIIRCEIFSHLDCKQFSNRLESIFLSSSNTDNPNDNGLCFTSSYIFYFMLKTARLKLHESNMLRKMAFNKNYLNKLWRTVCSLKTGDSNSKNEIYYLHILASGMLFRLYLPFFTYRI